MTPARRLEQRSVHGVAVWFDSIDRERLAGGGLAALARDNSVIGVTSNPTIFDHELSGGTDHAKQIRDLAFVLTELRAVGIDYDEVVDRLEREGTSKFVGAWTHLLENLHPSMSASQHG